MMNVFWVLFGFGSLITVIFPLGALFGFYDDREDGLYRFRTQRFFIMVALLVTLPICSILVLMFSLGDKMSDASKVAEVAVDKNRVIQFHTQENLKAAFPELLNDQTQPCYVSALSNYVEDQWKKSYHEETCKLGAQLCANDEKEFFELSRKKFNPHDFPLLDSNAMAAMLGTVWTTAKDTYITIWSFAGIIDPASLTKPHVGKDVANYEVYRQYFMNCGTLTPTPWALPNTTLIQHPAGLCLGNCL